MRWPGWTGRRRWGGGDGEIASTPFGVYADRDRASVVDGEPELEELCNEVMEVD